MFDIIISNNQPKIIARYKRVEGEKIKEAKERWHEKRKVVLYI